MWIFFADNVISFLLYGFFPLFIILQKTKTRLITFFVTYLEEKRIFYWSLIYDIQHLAGVQRNKANNVNGQDTMSSPRVQLITPHSLTRDDHIKWLQAAIRGIRTFMDLQIIKSFSIVVRSLKINSLFKFISNFKLEGFVAKWHHLWVSLSREQLGINFTSHTRARFSNVHSLFIRDLFLVSHILRKCR